MYEIVLKQTRKKQKNAFVLLFTRTHPLLFPLSTEV